MKMSGGSQQFAWRVLLILGMSIWMESCTVNAQVPTPDIASRSAKVSTPTRRTTSAPTPVPPTIECPEVPQYPNATRTALPSRSETVRFASYTTTDSPQEVLDWYSQADTNWVIVEQDAKYLNLGQYRPNADLYIHLVIRIDQGASEKTTFRAELSFVSLHWTNVWCPELEA